MLHMLLLSKLIRLFFSLTIDNICLFHQMGRLGNVTEYLIYTFYDNQKSRQFIYLPHCWLNNIMLIAPASVLNDYALSLSKRIPFKLTTKLLAIINISDHGTLKLKPSTYDTGL